MKSGSAGRLGVAITLCFLFTFSAFGQGSARVVKAQGFLSVDRVKPGSKFKVAVVLDVAAGYHINAHVPSLNYLIPTEVKFQTPRGIRIAEPRYPPPIHRAFKFAPQTRLAVHEGRVIVLADAQRDKTSVQPGKRAIVARVTVQSCNDTVCLAPARLTADIPVRFAGAGETVTEVHSELFAHASVWLSDKAKRK